MTETITKCPHCGFESEDDEMCRACGELFEEIPAPPARETKAATETTICPHCGFESEDDEMCRACGELFEDTPVRDISFAQVIGGIFSWMKDKGVHGVDQNPYFYEHEDNIFDSDISANVHLRAFEESPIIHDHCHDVLTDPVYSIVEGNIYHNDSFK